MLSRERSQEELSQTVTITSQKHCWRTLGGTRTQSYTDARQAMNDGCHIQDLTIVLRHPEAMLCDLSNLEPPLSSCSTADIEKLFAGISVLTDAAEKSEPVRRIYGEDLRPEIAVSAASKDLAKSFKARILKTALENNAIEPFDYGSRLRARGIGKSRHIISSSQNTQEIYNAFCAHYGRYVASTYWASSSALNQSLIYDDHIVWRQIESLGDNKLFIISAGLAIGLGYAESTDDDRLFFTEVHRQNDPSVLQRRAPFDKIYPDPHDLPGSWVVIDKAYTAGSIRHAKHRLRKQLGYDTEIITVALFPKSLEAVTAADYVVYAGRLIAVKDIVCDLLFEDWHVRLLRAGDN